MGVDIFLSNSLGQNYKMIKQPLDTKNDKQKNIPYNIFI